MKFNPIAASLFVLILSACSSDLGSQTSIQPSNDSPYLVKIKPGAVVGLLSEDNSYVTYKGIPYASAPVGILRFDAPKAVESLGQNALRADEFSKSCVQKVNTAIGLDEESMSEDCLSINVWKPVGAKKSPVLVYIHGGAFTFGSSSLPVYDGASFAKNGVVYVSFNYRIGIFGFYSHEVLFNNNSSVGNYGLMDQILALEWVKDNIEAFGGDADNITIMGSSAGGSSVGYLMTSPSVPDGLFHKAIIESGGGSGHETLIHYKSDTSSTNPNLPNNGKSPGYTRGENMLKDFFNGNSGKVGYSYTSDISCLEGVSSYSAVTEACKLEMHRSISWQDILHSPLGQIQAQPFIDDTIVTKGFMKHFEEGTQKKIPIIIGSNGWEASVNITNITASPATYHYGISLEDLRDTFAICSDDALLAEKVYGDKTFSVPARRIARLHAATGEKSFLYFFNYVAEGLLPTYPKGAPHHFLNPFVMKTYIEKQELRDVYPADTDRDRIIANVYHGYWLDFINKDSTSMQSLSSSNGLNWDLYEEQQDNLLFVNKFGTVSNFNNFLKSRFDFIENQTLDSAYSYNPVSASTCP